MKTGFTLVELIVVMGVAAVIMAVTTVNLLNGQNQTTKISLTNQIIADVRSQQTKAMVGDDNGLAIGVHFETDRYVLFVGSNYDATSNTNYVVNVSQILGTSLPNSNVIFLPISGEVSGYISGLNTVSVSDQILTINKYGVVTTD